MKDLDEAAGRGWKIITHAISVEKKGHVFGGSPEDVLARITRFEEHGDHALAISEAAQRSTQHDDINRLLRLIGRQAGEYLRQWGDYQKRCADLSDHRAHAAGLLNLDQATTALGKITEALAEVLEFPREVLLENEAFQAIREAV